ncbi:MAG TPA: hypothetical protein VK364_11715 [Hymenobacter sp.]|nr:hypothetical protein [Hymenobacter sp.]
MQTRLYEQHEGSGQVVGQDYEYRIFLAAKLVEVIAPLLGGARVVEGAAYPGLPLRILLPVRQQAQPLLRLVGREQAHFHFVVQAAFLPESPAPAQHGQVIGVEAGEQGR